MTDQTEPQSEAIDPAYQQAVKYGKDLARIYVAERAKREQLEIAYQLLDAIYRSMPNGIVVLDNMLKIERTNESFRKLIEATEQWLAGQAIDEVLSPEVAETINALTVNSNAPNQVEFTMVKPARRSLLATIGRLESGSLSGWIVTVEDQTNRKRMEYQKVEFVNIAAHELRTPLGQIMGYAEMLRDGVVEDADPTYASFVEAIFNGSLRLKVIVDEILEFAILNSGHTQPTGLTEFKLLDFVTSLSADLKRYQTEHNVEVRIDVGDPNLTIISDAAVLHTALYQLVLNGIAFNKPNGYVRVHAEAQGFQIHIEVIDNGIGIAQTELENIFQPFVQVEDHSTRSKNGLGLGLSIAQRAIESLSGTLSVESTLGRGTTFHIWLPLKREISDETTAETIELQAELATNQQQMLAYARDMQALYLKFREANLQLQDVNTQLEEANKLKSGFLGMVSHELRSPFVSIDFALQALTRYGTDTWHMEQRLLLEQLSGSFKDARQMIEHLVAYAGLVSKQGKLNLQPVDIRKVIDDNVVLLGPMAKSRKLDLLVSQAPANLTAGDRERISEAIWHLLHNAIKFTPAGGHITINTFYKNEYLVTQVQDNGIGISLDQQTRLWEAFAQVADPVKRGVEGLGLGLALVRYIAVAHGGKVTLHSELGKGSTFSLWLPHRSTPAT